MVGVLTVFIFAIEAAIMYLIQFTPPLPAWAEQLVDASTLTILLLPVIYYFIFRPMSYQISRITSDSVALKEELENLNIALEEKRQAQKEVLVSMEKLSQNEDKYRNLVDTLPNGIFVHCEGLFVFINPSGARILGAETPEQLLGRPMMDFVPPDYTEAVKERVKRILEQEVSVLASEEAFLRLDGTLIDVQVTAVPIIYQNKPAVQGIFIDITERKKAEKEIVDRIDDLERFRKATVTREFRIKELRDENEDLKRRLGIHKV